MDVLLQSVVLDMVLLSFQENTVKKEEAVREVYAKFDKLLVVSSYEPLQKTISFIDFIDGLYSEEDVAIKGILHVLKVETSKELDFKLEDEENKDGRLSMK